MTDEWYVIYFVYLVTTQPRQGLRIVPRGENSIQGTVAPQF